MMYLIVFALGVATGWFAMSFFFWELYTCLDANCSTV